ncbi:hypothetical protein ACFPRL_10425 [Pseudoclavibacter helvolus]
MPAGADVAHVQQVVERLREVLDGLGKRIREHGQLHLTLDAGRDHERLRVGALERLRDLFSLEQDDAACGARVALDREQPAVVVDEVERELARVVRVEGVDELLRVVERFRAVDCLEGDAGAVRPLLGRAVGAVRRHAAIDDDAVRADHRSVHERLHEPRLVGRGHCVLD